MIKSIYFFTITQAAEQLGISRAAVHKAIKKGRLEAERGTFEVTRIVKTKMRGWKIAADAIARYRVDLSRQERGRKRKFRKKRVKKINHTRRKSSKKRHDPKGYSPTDGDPMGYRAPGMGECGVGFPSICPH